MSLVWEGPALRRDGEMYRQTSGEMVAWMMAVFQALNLVSEFLDEEHTVADIARIPGVQKWPLLS